VVRGGATRRWGTALVAGGGRVGARLVGRHGDEAGGWHDGGRTLEMERSKEEDEPVVCLP
jgi:hypothetical protein